MSNRFNRSLVIDFIRGFCMFYINVGVFHLSQYLGNSYYLDNNEYGNSFMWSCLGSFSLISGYLIGSKYYCDSMREAIIFYKKRIIRFFPLFILSSICLYLINFNDLHQTIYAVSGLAPFVTHTPLTLWYISMIMIFYLISPIVLGRKRRKILSSLVIVFFFCLLYHLTIKDIRFIYNLMLYLIGVCMPLLKIEKDVRNRLLRFAYWGDNLSDFFLLSWSYKYIHISKICRYNRCNNDCLALKTTN